MNAALLPIRSLKGAKHRLGETLGENDRIDLTLAMLGDMISALESSSAVDSIVVTSSDPNLLSHARRLGVRSLPEGAEPLGLNGAVNQAADTLAAEGATTLLTIPGDVPLLCESDINRIFEEFRESDSILLVPSRSGGGTNALLTRPTNVIRTRFEGNSLAKFKQAAHFAGIVPRVLPLRSFQLDIDHAEDLERLAAAQADTLATAVAKRALKRAA